MSMVEVGKTNEGLMRVVSELMVYSDEIRGAMEESRRGMEEIVRAVYGVKEATSSLSERFEEVYGVLARGVGVLMRARDKLPLIIDSLRKLGEELGKFKVTEMRFTKAITLAE
ncbi:MAG: hypothetical protein ABDH28_02290, partial [Brevinematia bacterium]